MTSSFTASSGCFSGIKVYNIPKCEKCGCKGNNSCGHASLPGRGCELNEVLICPCCEAKDKKR